MIKPEQAKEAAIIMKSLPLFAGCSDDQIAALAVRVTPREIAAGKVVLMDQEIGRTLFVLAKGNVSVWKRLKGEKQKLATLPAPNFFGERTIFEESPASALVKTEEPCSLYALDRQEFDHVAKTLPGLSELIKTNMQTVRAQRMGPTPAAQPPQ